MPAIERSFSLLTAGFPHGAYQSQDNNLPELRATNVRGQIRWWYDALFGESPHNEIFGYVASKKKQVKDNCAGKISIRIKASPANAVPESVSFIPHKGQQGGNKKAYSPGASFQLSIHARREGLSQTEEKNLNRAVDAWLLCGGIGQRSNRAAGSVWPVSNAPQTMEDLTMRCRRLLQHTRFTCAVLPKLFEDEFELRHLAGDFLSDTAFLSCRAPFGSARPRKPSNLKLKAVALERHLRLLAVWDGRYQSSSDLLQGITKLAGSKEIGHQLQAVAEQLRG